MEDTHVFANHFVYSFRVDFKNANFRDYVQRSDENSNGNLRFQIRYPPLRML